MMLMMMLMMLMLLSYRTRPHSLQATYHTLGMYVRRGCEPSFKSSKPPKPPNNMHHNRHTYVRTYMQTDRSRPNTHTHTHRDTATAGIRTYVRTYVRSRIVRTYVRTYVPAGPGHYHRMLQAGRADINRRAWGGVGRSERILMRRVGLAQWAGGRKTICIHVCAVFIHVRTYVRIYVSIHSYVRTYL